MTKDVLVLNIRHALGRVPSKGLATVVRSAAAFGLVGLVGMVIDVCVYNLLRLGLLGPHLSFTAKPLTAGVISACIAIVFNWAGGRCFAFRDARRADGLRELGEYVLVALLGLGVGLATLAFTHYTLGLTSLAADNVSKNVVGLALGTSIRFVLLRFWVYGSGRSAAGTGAPGAVNTSTGLIGSRPIQVDADLA